MFANQEITSAALQDLVAWEFSFPSRSRAMKYLALGIGAGGKIYQIDPLEGPRRGIGRGLQSKKAL